MRFQYTGVTRQREQVRGVVEAADEVEARMRLRAMQIRPSDLREKRDGEFIFNLSSLSLGNPVPLKQLIIFTRQFSSLVDSGVPVVQCLDILYEQEKRGALKKVLSGIKEHIEAGGSLAEALAKHPRVFSEFFIRIVEAGELSGTLDLALRRIGLQLEKLGRLRSKVVGALTYPLITMLVAVVVLIFMLVKVIPGVAKLYNENQAQLPDLTIFVLGLSDWFQQNYSLLVGGVVGFPIVCLVLYRVPGFRVFWDPIVLRIPLFGSLIKKSTIARFARTMSTLVSSGVPLLNCFEICVKLVSNTAVKSIIQRAASSVQEGKSIAQGLSTNNLFPPMVVHMVNIGEMTGKLDELMGKVADIYDDEVDDAVSAMTGLLQPMLIVFVGGIVAFLLIAMYLPIFQLAEKVTGG